MVMAAGFGTRMGPLTADRPKPLLQAGGKALVDHALDDCVAAGVTRAVINLHYRGDQIRAHLATRQAPEIVYSPEDPVLETGGGVVRALPHLGAVFYVVNADAVFTGPPPLAALAAAWDPDAMDALLLVAPLARVAAHPGAGDFFLDAGRLRRRGGAATAPYVYTGAQIIKAAAFAGAPDGPFSTNLIWDRLLTAGRCFGAVHPGGWVDVGTPEGLAAADAALRGRDV